MLNILIAFLVGLGCIAYIYGVFKACALSLKEVPNPAEMPSFLVTVITTIGGLLSTNLGAVLGIEITNPGAFTTFNLFNADFFTGTEASLAQKIACWVYVLSLLACLIVWGIKRFDEKLVLPVIAEFSKTLFGVVIGVLAITLAMK